MDKNSMTSLSVSLHMVRMMCAPFCIFVYGPVLSPVSRMMRVGESVYVIDEVSGSVGVCTKPSTGKETAPIDRNAPFISGIGAAGIKLGTRYEDIAEILEADDVVYDDDMAWYRYTVPGVIDFSFARCNDRIFSIGLYPGYKGKVLGYENIWECTEKEFFSDGYGNYEYLDEDECYESRENRVDISFDDETGKTDWVAVRLECALGNSSEMDLSDWTLENDDSSESEIHTESFFTEGAIWDEEFPICKTTAYDIPEKIITCSEINSTSDTDAFVSFYDDDQIFDGPNGIWNNPEGSISKLSRFKGIITPDFSTYDDFPLPLKKYNTWRMRAFGYWLGKRGFKVINNVRWGGSETWSYAFRGIEKGSIVAIGTVGGSPNKRSDRERFNAGFYEMLKVLEPKVILVCGSDRYPCFDEAREQGIKIYSYKGRMARSFEKSLNK